MKTTLFAYMVNLQVIYCVLWSLQNIFHLFSNCCSSKSRYKLIDMNELASSKPKKASRLSVRSYLSNRIVLWTNTPYIIIKFSTNQCQIWNADVQLKNGTTRALITRFIRSTALKLICSNASVSHGVICSSLVQLPSDRNLQPLVRCYLLLWRDKNASHGEETHFVATDLWLRLTAGDNL